MPHPNEKVIRDVLAAFQAGNREAIARIYAEDVVLHIPGDNLLSGDYKGLDEVLDALARFKKLTNETWTAELHDLLANEEHAVALFTRRGERGGRFGVFRAVTIYHFRGGRIAEIWIHEADQQAFDEFFS
jgi:ketosteroid isomerase-like protein